MARKDIRMEELVAVLYQWHKERNISQIKRALELDRKSIPEGAEALPADRGACRSTRHEEKGYKLGRLQKEIYSQGDEIRYLCREY